MDFTELFCSIDDFIKLMSERQDPKKSFFSSSRRGPSCQMSLSEILTIIVGYHDSGFKNFKKYYFYLSLQHKNDFPKLLSYNRFIEIMPLTLTPLILYLRSRMGKNTGISFIDSTSIAVCKNLRINSNKVFKGIAARGKTSCGWFYGFKLHFIINHVGEIMSFSITTGDKSDSSQIMKLCKKIKGKIFGDKGYIGKKIFNDLFKKGLKLITGIRNNMNNQIVDMEEKLLLKKRFIIETINDQLKNIYDIEHSRHRSVENFFINLLAGVVAYTHKAEKPSIRMRSFGFLAR